MRWSGSGEGSVQDFTGGIDVSLLDVERRQEADRVESAAEDEQSLLVAEVDDPVAAVVVRLARRFRLHDLDRAEQAEPALLEDDVVLRDERFQLFGQVV